MSFRSGLTPKCNKTSALWQHLAGDLTYDLKEKRRFTIFLERKVVILFDWQFQNIYTYQKRLWEE